VRELRAQRYELQATARLLFSAEGRKEGLKYGHDYHRTAKCKHISRSGSGAGVHRDQEHGSAFYSGLVTCGSVWACPICAAVIQERRREEIAAAIDWAHANGMQPVMVTLTFPHTAWDSLPELLERQADAFRRLRRGKVWQRIKQRMGYQGLIRSLELTHGENGWHPHTHEIWIVGAHVDAEDLQATIVQRWADMCERAGLLSADKRVAFERHAVDVKGWCSASDYLAKQDDSRHWGADREMAKASTKAGKAKGKHAFGLLADAAEGDDKAGKLYVEYAEAVKGRRQIYWTQGLKDLVGINDLTDEELAEESRESADLLGALTLEEWRLVRKAGKRAQVLDAAETGGWRAVQAVVSGLRRLTKADAGVCAPAHPPRPSVVREVGVKGSQAALRAPLTPATVATGRDPNPPPIEAQAQPLDAAIDSFLERWAEVHLSWRMPGHGGPRLARPPDD
jgi:hypothetical protein